MKCRAAKNVYIMDTYSVDGCGARARGALAPKGDSPLIRVAINSCGDSIKVAPTLIGLLDLINTASR